MTIGVTICFIPHDYLPFIIYHVVTHVTNYITTPDVTLYLMYHLHENNSEFCLYSVFCVCMT